ncbi:MAG: helix-turn-helix domain-containing protein [Candidatus Tectomicrobia bacterium]
MNTTQTSHNPQYGIPSILQRLEPIKERLYADYLQAYLDAPCKIWYVRTATTYLAQHLLEVYRRRTEKVIRNKGFEALSPDTRRHLMISTTDTGDVSVSLHVSDTDAAHAYPTLARALEERYQGPAWDNLARRLALDLSTWALEMMQKEMGSTAIAAMNDTAFDAKITAHIVGTDADHFLTRFRHFLNLAARHAAFDLATTIEARESSLAELEHMLGLCKTTPRATRLLSMLRDEHFTVMSASHYHAIREAIYKNSFQHIDGIPWPAAPLATGPARGHAELRPVVVETAPLMPPEERDAWAQRMWQQREELTDLDADVLDALSAIWLYQARTPQEDAVADVDELLAIRGLQPKQGGQGRRGGYEPQQRMHMLQALGHIQNLWLNMSEIVMYEPSNARTRRRKPTRQAIQSRAFTITDLFGQLRPDGFMNVEKFVFRPGKVFAHFLHGAGRQTALLSACALAYDPYRQKWEKRLTRYLSWQWRTRAHAGNYLQPYRVDTLLEAVGQSVNPRRCAWQRGRLEKTMDTIQDDNVIATWQYKHLDEVCWARSTMLIEPPDSIQDAYQRITQHEATSRRLLPILTTLGERLKQRRRALGLSQIRTAEQLEISQAYLSLLERGRKTQHGAALKKRISVWLGEL